MENNSSPTNNTQNDENVSDNMQNKGKIASKISEAKQTAAEAAKLVASAETGNIGQAVKSAAKLAKSKTVKKGMKRNLIAICASILVVIIIAVALLSIFTNVVDKLIELASGLGKSIRTFWKWIIDDYWIRLDDDIEYTATDNTRSGSYKKRKISRRIYKTISRFRNFIAFTKIIRRF